MSLANTLREQCSLLWKFLGFFQPPAMRRLHAVVVLWVGMQYLTSNLLKTPLYWTHLYGGLLLLALSVFFTGYAWKTRGIRRYYGYLWGETDVLLKDIKDALRFKMVAPRAGGLATLVQGLGFGALLLALLTGAGLYMSYRLHWPGGKAWEEAHEFSVALLGLYVCGHGIMALLHFAKWQMTVVRKTGATPQKNA